MLANSVIAGARVQVLGSIDAVAVASGVAQGACIATRRSTAHAVGAMTTRAVFRA